MDVKLTIFYHANRETFLITAEWTMCSSLFIYLTIFTPQTDILSIFLYRTLDNILRSQQTHLYEILNEPTLKNPLQPSHARTP